MMTSKLNEDNYSPKNSIEEAIEVSPQNMKNRRKDRQILLHSPWFISIKDYEKLKTVKLKVEHLKDLCTYYKVKKTGKKSDLIMRLFTFLEKSNKVLMIQSCFRKHLRKIYVSSAGPGLRKRDLCRNETDFYSLEDITKIPSAQFYSISDNQGNVFGFDMMSIYQLIQSCSCDSYNAKPVLNPYTREALPIADVLMVNIRIRLSALLKIPVNVKPKQENIEDSKKVEMDCIAIFQIINDLGNYADSSWFEALDKHDLLRFLRELYDIWNYRAQISEQTKREIVHPRGNPFEQLPISSSSLQEYEIIKKNAMNIMTNFITKGIDREHCSLGALYVLSALTLVSSPAQVAIPWLYQSVM